MKKGFTTFSFHERGFTLVELLVVIAIIAILSVVGITVFTGVQKKAQDAKLKGDVAAFATAYELKYNQATGRYPSSFDTSSFVGGIPLQPDGTPYSGSGGSSCTSSSCDLLGIGNTDKPFRICAILSTGERYCKYSVRISDRGGTVTRTNVWIADLSTPTPIPSSSPSPSPTASAAPTASPSPSPSPALTASYIQTNVGCSTPLGLTPDQICQREVSATSRAVPVSGTTAAKGYWWKQCSGASVSNCNGLDCTVNNLDCTNTPGYWGSQQPYPSEYLKSGNNTTVYKPTSPTFQLCAGYSPGWTMRVYCSR